VTLEVTAKPEGPSVVQSVEEVLCAEVNAACPSETLVTTRIHGITSQETVPRIVITAATTDAAFPILSFASFSNLIKPDTYFMYHQLSHSEILRSTHNAFMCFAWISEQTAIISLYSIN
jgi:hypothetical protein